MTLFDHAVLAIVGVSVLAAAMRGLVRELFAVLGWVLAFWLSMRYAGMLAPHLPPNLPGETVRLLAAFVAIFLTVLLVATLLAASIARIFRALGMGPLDRLLGALFGFVRGMIIVLALVVVGGMTSLPRQPFWRNATFSAPLEAMVASLEPWLPEAVSRHLRYE